MGIIESDTIAAIATAFGEASIGVIRVSGDKAEKILTSVFRRSSGAPASLPRTRHVMYGQVVHPQTAATLDECLLLWMPGPHSYTAEDVGELQIHGGLRVVQSVLEAVLLAGARMAEPGEFTKRAFLNGRIDLAQAEAVIDLIRSKTDLAASSALNQVKGYLSDSIRTLRKDLVSLQALVEITIDYPEHDVEAEAAQDVVRRGSEMQKRIEHLLSSARMGQILRDGIATGILGRPNVGKSSLLNALLRRERAIVTEIAGTTRDVLEEYVNVRGIPFKLVDTAGIRETEDIVEQIGVQKSREIAQSAELVLLVLDASQPLTDEDLVMLRETQHSTRIIVLNKADLPMAVNDGSLAEFAGQDTVVALSARNMEGIARLEEVMEKLVLGGSVERAEAAYMTNARQASLLSEAASDLRLGIEAAESGMTLDVVAVQLQAAYASLGLVIGEAVGEDLLDEIFSQFCLGK